MHPQLNTNSSRLALLVMQFGQFLDHDLALTPEAEVRDCCGRPQQEDCFPILIPATDSFYSSRREPQQCQEFGRSLAFCPGSQGQGQREQFNSVTSLLDLSQVYGSDPQLSSDLRAKRGKLRTNSRYSREMLPLDSEGRMVAGDIRALDMPGLAAVQTLFLRSFEMFHLCKKKNTNFQRTQPPGHPDPDCTAQTGGRGNLPGAGVQGTVRHTLVCRWQGD